MRLNLSPDAAGGTPAVKPPKPTTPAVVKKTPLKTPAEISLEKEVARLRDDLDAVNSKVKATDDFLAGLQLGRPTPAPATPPAVKKGLMDDLAKSLGLA